MLPGELNPSLPPPSMEKVKELLDDAELKPSVLGMLPHLLSFGMLQRVCLVRTLAYSPRFLLLDETFTGLDPATAEQIGELVANYRAAHGAACVLVTHDFLMAAKCSDDFVVIGTEARFAQLGGQRSEADLRAALFTLCTRQNQ
jgi:ABC-type transporter Mla maintaining outer membrane lipid asymmetry ATPase subunit MlaF